MTTPETGSELTSTARDGRIIRLNPRDGLFLRSVHLNRMQDYARELALCVGMAGGGGVVHGYRVSLAPGRLDTIIELQVRTGLAIAPVGRPLRSTQDAVVELEEKHRPADGWYYVVEVRPAQIASGDEPVYGALCDDPCSDRSTIRSALSEGVEVVLRPERIEYHGEQLHQQPRERQRAWLAAAWFERERIAAGSWLGPYDPGKGLLRHDWTEPAPEPTGNAVPLAVLWWDGKDWRHDTWTARRDRIDPPPLPGWLGRLGMRPWSVFIAQVLQFQDQLADVLGAASRAMRTLPDDDLRDAIAECMQLMESGKRAKQAKVLAALYAGMSLAAVSLENPWFPELPPAGFLPVGGDAEKVEEEVRELLAGVELRFCTCRPDDVGREIEAAQHRDRIRLGGQTERVDVLVPRGRKGWVAFVRRPGIECPDTDEELEERVAVSFYKFIYDNELETVRTALLESQSPAVDPSWTTDAIYPARGWRVPGGDAHRKLNEDIDRGGPTAVVVIVSAEDRRALGAVRATLLVGRFDDDDPGFEIHFRVRSGEVPEQIVVLNVGA